MSVKYLTNTLWFHNIFSSFNSRSYCTYNTFGSRVINDKMWGQNPKLLSLIWNNWVKKKKFKHMYYLLFFTWEKEDHRIQIFRVFYIIIYSKLLRTWLTWMSKFVSQLHDTLQNYCNYALKNGFFLHFFLFSKFILT